MVELDQIIQVLLSTNMAVGGLTGFVLDNIIPGTDAERGLIKWRQVFNEDGTTRQVASVHVYDVPFITHYFGKSRACKYIPFLPYYGETTNKDQEMGEVTPTA